ncbi:MAG TPA: hypothetical protein VF529_18335 [Solirubrobacteraceae bacterium]|jgi:hypothetical protein
MSGRDYFDARARELKIDGLDPSQVAALGPLKLKVGAAESRVGGKITRDLKRLSPEEAAEHRRKADELLSKPPRHFPAED